MRIKRDASFVRGRITCEVCVRMLPSSSRVDSRGANLKKVREKGARKAAGAEEGKKILHTPLLDQFAGSVITDLSVADNFFSPSLRYSRVSAWLSLSRAWTRFGAEGNYDNSLLKFGLVG